MSTPADPPPPRTLWAGLHADGGPSNRAVLRVFLLLVFAIAVLWLVWYSRSVVLLVGISAFLSVAIDPPVRALGRRARFPRPLSVAVVFILVIMVLSLAVAILIPPVIDAAEELTAVLPTYAEQLRDSAWVQSLDERYDLINQIEARLQQGLGDIAGPDTAVDIAGRIANGLVALITVAVMTFLFSLYGPRLRAWTLAQLPPDNKERGDRVMGRMYEVIAGYVVGQLAIALVAGLIAAAFLTVLDIPGATVLAFWVSLMTLVPLVGATLGGIPYVTVAFFQSIPLGIAALAFLLIYQQVENNLIQPVIHRRTVNLNPLWIIIAVLVGARLLGIAGVLLAIPVAGIAQVVIQDAWANRRRIQRDPATQAVLVPQPPKATE